MEKTKKSIFFGLTLIGMIALGFALSYLRDFFWPGLGLVGVARAVDLHTDLVIATTTVPWLPEMWRIALGLANAFVAIILLFFAIVNIAHIQYDTYQLKKSLPKLILGIVMANFSLVIGRMIVDMAQILTNTFAADADVLIRNLMCALSFDVSSGGLASYFSGAFAVSIIWIILVGLAILIGVLIISFLLWLRKIIILMLVAVAPVAFVMLAFPPTEQYFKQWWDWFIKWAFMGPIVMFLIWVASRVGATNCSSPSITTTFLVCLILYLAAIVPFKLGGAVMGAWGKAGQWASGTGKGGYMRKPVDDYIDRRKRQAKAWAGQRLPGFRNIVAAGKADEMETALREKEAAAAIEKRARERRGRRVEEREQRTARAEADLKKGIEERTTKFFDTLEGRIMIEASIDDSIATGRLEQAKQERIFQIYSGDRQADLQKFEGDIASTAQKLEKIKDDSRVSYASESLSAAGEIGKDKNKPLFEALKKRRDLDTKYKRDPSAENKKAFEDTDKEAKRLMNEAAQGLVDDGQFDDKTEALDYLKKGDIDNYAEKRYYSIAAKRGAEDASVDAQSNSPIQVEEAFDNEEEGHKYGPWKAPYQDGENFFTGEALSNGEAGHLLATELNQLRLQMNMPKVKSRALKSYCNILNKKNGKLLGATVKRAWDGMGNDDKNKMLKFAQEKGIGDGERALKIEEMQQLMTEHQLNTNDKTHAGFANAVMSQFEEADGRVLAFKNDRGEDDTAFGRTGMGRSYWWYSKKSGKLERNEKASPPPAPTSASASEESEEEEESTEEEELP